MEKQNLDELFEINKYKNINRDVNNKYPGLITLANLYKSLAIIVGIAAIIGFFYGLSLPSRYGMSTFKTILIIVSLLVGTVGFINLLSIGEIIRLFIDVERNTRLQIALLKKLSENFIQKNDDLNQ